MQGNNSADYNKRLGSLVVISGPSGAGKGTVCKKLLERNKGLKLSISATTRPPRDGEINGESYFFVTKEEFEQMEERGELFESAVVFGNKYGTPKEFVVNQMMQGNDIILEIDVQGAMQVMQSFPQGVYVFLLPPTMDELMRRKHERAANTKEIEEEIKNRLKGAYEEMNRASEYDYVIINDDLDTTVEDIEKIIYVEKFKPDKNKELIARLRSENL